VKNSIDAVIRQYAEQFDSESEDENNVSRDNAVSDVIWSNVSGTAMKNFHFDVQNTGINPDIYVNYHDKEPYDFFTIFLTPEVLANIVNQTNIYAEQQKNKTKFPKSRLHKWVNTNKDEIKKFMGIILLAYNSHNI